MLSFILLVVGVLAQQTFAEEPEAIVGGQPAAPGEFPYQVFLRRKGSNLNRCGGSIIGPTKILTAAHCVNDIAHPYTNLEVLSGTIDIWEGGHLHKVKNIRVHPEYNSKEFPWVNDIAVITLSEPIQYDQHQAPIALTETKPIDGQQCTLAGWGRIMTNAVFGRPLRKINQVVMSLEKCQKLRNVRLPENQLCAYNRYGIGACYGDSGGPLVSNGKQIGVYAWTTTDCAIGIPDVYMNVYYYRNFILSS